MKKTHLIPLAFALLFAAASCGGQKGPEKEKIGSVTIFGNSIVAHDPAPEIGWTGDWGMAASCRDSDFVHLVKAGIGRIGPHTRVTWENLSAFERDYAGYDLSQLDGLATSDLIIVKISENVKYEAGMEARFTACYDRLIRKLTGPRTVVLIAEGFWPSPVNDMIRRYALSRDYPFIALADLFASDKSNAAIGLFDNEGVANHPSDKGMRNIAARIMEVVERYEFE